jgi:uncharacterized SAM-binding protein YcdF (DUF218 family)
VSYLQPALPLFLALGILGLVRAWRRSTKGDRPILLTVSIVGMVVLSLNVFASLAALPLEIWYDRDSPFPRESAEAIVVLAGSAHSPTPNRPYTFAGSDTYRRLEHAAWLFKHWKPVPILVCGGTLNEDPPIAETMRRVLEAEGGIPPEMIWTEKRSRSTHENAVYGSEILREHGISRIAVVVEASSMPRAAASFRKFGFTVVPMPIRFAGLDREFSDVIPTWDAIAMNGETLHELVGLLWYFLRGWI